MNKELRTLAEAIAGFIREDKGLQESGHVTVVVEDAADVEMAIRAAIGRLGVLVLVIVTGFDRRDNSGAVLFGTVRMEIRCYEHPSLNRDGTAWTAQHVMEHLVKLLHWRVVPGLQTPMRFKNFARDDVQSANIVRSQFVFDHVLGQNDEITTE